ncbi:group 1 glycosyl transferase [Gracilibacillus halophilus YIM-C55.5]|uniref:Group 1 glycosyl transferase n=1 Tax=Gracilibacillus halophilus YIM-C55.5 TaxID=1308866 RepID=N4WKB6_9BACI|nr:glycosyltransferase [Gracilibacillus halophilus]ENH96577.1 group 1 glycosyl transferase [Gracilibacillus halophilus YIM-C55.5]
MRSQKKVVHLTTVHHPFDTRIYHKECLSLAEAGYQVSLIAPASVEDVEQADQRLSLIPLKKYTSRLLRMILGTWHAYRKARHIQADVYHFHDPELLPIAFLLKKKNNAVIYDVHEDYYTSIIQKPYLWKPLRKWIGKMYNVIERFLTRKMELFLAEKYYRDRYHRGMTVLNYPIINQALLEKPTGHDSSRKLIYTGNVSEDRGALFHAEIPTYKDVDIYFVGKCPSALSEKMKQIAHDQRDSLVFDGIDQFVEREAIDRYYVKHDWLAGVAIFPPTEHYKKKELTKFFEYMSAGLPIICSNFSAWEQFIEAYQCGITVNPYDEEAIKQSIEYLQNHPQEAKRMGENGRKAVLEELSWQTQEQKLVQWYDQTTDNQATKVTNYE